MQVFNKGDTNGDGLLSKDEARVAYEGYFKQHHPNIDMTHIDIFTAIWNFADKTSFIEKQQLNSLISTIEPVLLKAADSNKDGRVDPDEFLALMVSADTDNNKTVSLKEVLAKWVEMTKPVAVTTSSV